MNEELVKMIREEEQRGNVCIMTTEELMLGKLSLVISMSFLF